MSEVKPLVREALLEELRQDPLWDVVVIGGGATGVGIAVDAASRGLKTVLLEAQDFAAGTSSRSTKLIHGGVRYMKNPRDWGLVREALKERRILIKNAPHLVHAKPFILPTYKKWEREYFTVGLGIYSAMTYGGHVILLHHTTTGDGELTAGKLLKLLAKSGKKMSELNGIYAQYPQVLVNVAANAAQKAAYKEDKVLADFIGNEQQKLMDMGRVLVRVSGTEPKIRVMVEGQDLEAIDLCAKRIVDKINERIIEG